MTSVAVTEERTSTTGQETGIVDSDSSEVSPPSNEENGDRSHSWGAESSSPKTSPDDPNKKSSSGYSSINGDLPDSLVTSSDLNGPSSPRDGDQSDAGIQSEALEQDVTAEDKTNSWEGSPRAADNFSLGVSPPSDCTATPPDGRSSRISAPSSGSVTDYDDGDAEAETVAVTDGLGGFSRSGSEGAEDDLSVTSSPGLRHSPMGGHQFSMVSGEHCWYDRSAESMAYSANLAFPDQSLSSSICATPVDGMSPIRREHKCGIFTVDLSK